jgi:hypothetical protein
MKKSILIVTSLFISLISTPILAQEDLGADPDVPAAPIDDYILLLAFIGIIFVLMRFRSLHTKKIKRQNRQF